MTATTPQTGIVNSLTTGRLPRWTPWALLGGSWAVMSAVFALVAAASGTEFNIALAIFLGTILFDVLIYVVSYLVEGPRQATNRLVTSLVATAFIIALLPLISLLFTVIIDGLPRFDLAFFSQSMRNVVGPGGGALHAITGTLLITGMAAIPVDILFGCRR